MSCGCSSMAISFTKSSAWVEGDGTARARASWGASCWATQEKSKSVRERDCAASSAGSEKSKAGRQRCCSQVYNEGSDDDDENDDENDGEKERGMQSEAFWQRRSHQPR